MGREKEVGPGAAGRAGAGLAAPRGDGPGPPPFPSAGRSLRPPRCAQVRSAAGRGLRAGRGLGCASPRPRRRGRAGAGAGAGRAARAGHGAGGLLRPVPGPGAGGGRGTHTLIFPATQGLSYFFRIRRQPSTGTPGWGGGARPHPRPPLAPRGQPQAPGLSSSRRPAGQAAPRASSPSPLLSLRCPPRPRSPRSVCPPLRSPRVFGRGRRGTAEPPARRPCPPAGGALRASSPTSHGAKAPAGHRGSPQPLGPGPAQPGGRSHKAGRFPPPRGFFFFFGGSGRARRGAGRSCTRSRRRCGGPSRAGSRVPAGSGLPPAPPPAQLPAGALLARPRPSLGRASPAPAGGRHRPRREKFRLPLPDLRFIKNKRKTFPSGAFRCVGKAAAAGAARGGGAPLPPAGSGPSRPPGPLPGRRREGGGREGWREFPR
ncbi:uncharacterized protein LJ206_006817 [Theristicus caerulescens]